MDPFLINNIEVVIQQKIQPIQNYKLCTWIQIHKCLMICLHSKLLPKNIWMKLLNHKNNCQKFPLQYKIILLPCLKSFQCKYNIIVKWRGLAEEDCWEKKRKVQTSFHGKSQEREKQSFLHIYLWTSFKHIFVNVTPSAKTKKHTQIKAHIRDTKTQQV